MSTDQSISINEISKSRKTILNLLKRQGFDTSSYDNIGINELNILKTNDQLDMLITNTSDSASTPKIYIKYYLGKTIRPQMVQDMIDDLFHLEEMLGKNDILYIILKDEINDTMSNFLKHIWNNENIYIVMESYKRLQFNILDHDLVPQHIILNENDTNIVMEKYNLKSKENFPEISRFDPVAKAILLKPGMICEITRPSKTSIKSKYYRLCI
jgi:DNA-directed RNA polymerase subunit H